MDDFNPKGWHSAVRAIFNGLYDAREALRRNNRHEDYATINKWLFKAMVRAHTKFRVTLRVLP